MFSLFLLKYFSFCFNAASCLDPEDPRHWPHFFPHRLKNPQARTSAAPVELQSGQQLRLWWYWDYFWGKVFIYISYSFWINTGCSSVQILFDSWLLVYSYTPVALNLCISLLQWSYYQIKTRIWSLTLISDIILKLHFVDSLFFSLLFNHPDNWTELHSGFWMSKCIKFMW